MTEMSLKKLLFQIDYRFTELQFCLKHLRKLVFQDNQSRKTPVDSYAHELKFKVEEIIFLSRKFDQATETES